MKTATLEGKTVIPKQMHPTHLIRRIQKGLPFSELEALRKDLDLPLDQLAGTLAISRATLHRRKAAGRLSPDESGKVIRFSRLLEHAVTVFGNVEKGRAWLKFPQYGLGGAVPLDYAKTEIGAREVDNLLGRIDYGVYSQEPNPMGSGWRIVPANRAQAAFTGEGPWRYGGRWNSPGVRVVYISEHQSTAAFEVFANRMPFILEGKYKAFYAEWADSFIERFPLEKLPANWRIHPPPMETRRIGDGWVKERRSVVLALPSAVSPADSNFLLNPQHPDFKRIRIAPPIDFEFDSRLLNR